MGVLLVLSHELEFCCNPGLLTGVFIDHTFAFTMAEIYKFCPKTFWFKYYYRPLMRFFGPGKNRVKGKPRYRRSILVLKPPNGEFKSSKSTFSQIFTSVKGVKLQEKKWLKKTNKKNYQISLFFFRKKRVR